MKVLNPELYNALVRAFGKVTIANQGQRAHVQYIMRRGKRIATPKHGEYYCVNCPMCKGGDDKQHLWISHMYREFDPSTGTRFNNAGFCYRCGGSVKESYIEDMVTPSFIDLRAVKQKVTEEVEIEPVQPMAMPDATFVRLTDLPLTHPACAYLVSRGFDVVEVATNYSWMYCHDAKLPVLARRIFIPVFHEDEDGKLIMAGYQMRAIPSLSVCEEPKYYTAKGFAKSRVLYNLQNAKKHNIVVITEGITDAARVGPQAISLLGKTMSEMQLELLCKQCKNSRAAVMLDEDATSSAYRIMTRLNSGGVMDNHLRKGAFMVRLPKGDPGDYKREWLLEYINECDRASKRLRVNEVRHDSP